jgi:hypothetical protein
MVLALGALASNKTIDNSTVENTIKSGASDKGITLSTISCPQGQKAQSGGTFNCTSTTSDGTAITWNITLKNDQGELEYKATNVLDEQKIGDDIEPKMKASTGGKPFDMKCPSKWIVSKKGATFECDATLDGQATKSTCTFTDDSGNIDCKTPPNPN